MTSRPENEAGGVPPKQRGNDPDGAPTGPTRREIMQPPRFPARIVLMAVVAVLVLALVAGAVLLWGWYGDQAGGTSLFEDSVAAGPEPVVRLVNGPGQVRIEGVEDLQNVEITAKRYARGSDPAAAKENAAGVEVNFTREGGDLEISSSGGSGTGVDYALRVPAGARVEVESEAGDVEVSGFSNDVSATAGAGDVTVADIRGSVMVEAPKGDVSVEAVSTETGNVVVEAGSSDVTFTDLIVGILQTRVEAGDVELLGRFSGGGLVLVETGDILVRLAPEDTRELDLEARVGEVVRENAPEGEPEEAP